MGTDDVVPADELAASAGITVTVLTALVDLGVVEPARPDGSAFAAIHASRLRRMVRLRADLGVSYVAAGIIVDLLERIDRLERR